MCAREASATLGVIILTMDSFDNSKVPLVDGNGRLILGEDGLPVFDEVVSPDDLDLSAEHDYLDKCDFLSDNLRTGFPDMTEIYLRDFLDMIFVRYGEEPFEEINAHNYQVWYKQASSGVEPEQIDYSECDDRRKWNAVVLTRKMRETTKGGTSKTYDRCEQTLLLKDDWQHVDWLEKRYFALMSPLTYKGKSTKAENARMLFAFGVDLDDVGIEQLECLFLYIHRTYPIEPMKGNPIIMPPNIIVNSGHGLHLYYILEHPIPLGQYSDRNNALLKYISDRLYNMTWWPYDEKSGEPGTSKKNKVAHLGIYHPFRIPGTLTKPLRYNKAKQRATGRGLPIRAWSLGVSNYTIDDFVRRWGNDDEFDKMFTPDVITKLKNGDRILNPKHLTREEAMRAYPNWNPDATEKGHYEINRRLYDSWLDKMRRPDKTGVREGHRYYCIVALVSFAKKCGISFEEVSRDAYSLLDLFDSLEARSDNRFTRNDIKKALSFYYYDKSVRYSRIKLESSTGIPMPKTKRNRRKQEQHLKTARFAQNLDDPNGEWRNMNGRPVATLENSRRAQLVAFWRYLNPDMKNKSACSTDTGLSRPTVTKWWNATLCQDVLTVRTWKIENIEKYSGEEKTIRQCWKDTGIPIGNIRKWWIMTVDEIAKQKEEMETQQRLDYTRGRIGLLDDVQRRIYEWKVSHSLWRELKNSMELAAEELNIPLETVRELWDSVDELFHEQNMVNDLTTSKDFVSMTKLFEPGSNYRVEGYTHKQTVDIVTSGKWKELDWNIVME